MELELFAQVNQNSEAYKAGARVGTILAMLITAPILPIYGYNRGQTLIGVIGAIFVIPAAYFFGCVGGLPVALLFVGIIAVVSSEGWKQEKKKKKRKKKPRPEDDEDDRPRRSRRDEEVDEDERPRRSRRDDDEADENERPRRRRSDG